jgi:Domain of unknown function (DUF5063)
VEPDEFLEAAEAFISLVDASATEPLAQFVPELERRILDLYVTALKLEPGEPTSEAPPPGMSGEDSWAVVQRLSHQFGDFDRYSLVFDPFNIGEEPVIGSLADDVADIYRGLKDGFAALRDEGVRDAVWCWRLGFDTHWGQHAAQALPALYHLGRQRLPDAGVPST